MKCTACNYESQTEQDDKFIKIEINGIGPCSMAFCYSPDIYDNRYVDLYACPKCGTVRMEKL